MLMQSIDHLKKASSVPLYSMGKCMNSFVANSHKNES